MRHNRIAITVEYGCVSLRMRFFSQNYRTIKRILPGSSSPSHREGPGTEVGLLHFETVEKLKCLCNEIFSQRFIGHVLEPETPKRNHRNETTVTTETTKPK